MTRNELVAMVARTASRFNASPTYRGLSTKAAIKMAIDAVKEKGGILKRGDLKNLESEVLEYMVADMKKDTPVEFQVIIENDMRNGRTERGALS